MRWTVGFVVLLVLSLVVLAWPARFEGPILFILTTDHGLTLSDVIGFVPLSIGWITWLTGIWRRRAKVAAAVARSPGLAVIGAFVAGMGAGLLLATARISFWWLAIGLSLLTAAAVSLAPILSRRGGPSTPERDLRQPPGPALERPGPPPVD
jgi:ABC-type thiamin/hydroxymethylpyrimidine transport system permease subunit